MRLRQLRDLAASGNPVTFITLTVNPAAYESPDEAAQALTHAWRMVVQRAKRDGFTADLQYLAVFEETEKGWPHLHILARTAYIPQQWLSDRMRDYARSPIVDIRAIKSRRVASRYVAKYVSKGPGRYQGTKRYWRSQRYQQGATGWERSAPVHDRPRFFHQAMPETLADSYRRVGWRVTWESHDLFTAERSDGPCHRPWMQYWFQDAIGPPT